MKSLSLAFAFLLCSPASGPAATQDKPQVTTPPPAAVAVINTAPADHQRFTASFSSSNEEDEDGNQPPTIDYFQKGSRDDGTFMAVTDLSLCRRPSQRATCQSFGKMISAAPPPLGTDITDSRIGGGGYATIFFARVDEVALDGVDAATAFIGGDTQDPPAASATLYIYARRGSNLIQLTTKAGRCTALPRPKEKDVSYYRRACVNRTVLAKASAAGRRLVELFRLAR
ncbi:MAG TPA: hypothetical protein VMW75_09740 [Thermoanaerobaculia bacterium]|nr:hypothetical protein [Thermoanaerobaculia bacterium]